MWSRKNRLKKLLRLEKGKEKFKSNVARLAKKTFSYPAIDRQKLEKSWEEKKRAL